MSRAMSKYSPSSQAGRAWGMEDNLTTACKCFNTAITTQLYLICKHKESTITAKFCIICAPRVCFCSGISAYEHSFTRLRALMYLIWINSSTVICTSWNHLCGGYFSSSSKARVLFTGACAWWRCVKTWRDNAENGRKCKRVGSMK